jgi:hypothetical protein
MYDTAFLPTIEEKDVCVGKCFAVVNTLLGDASLSFIAHNKEDALKQMAIIKKKSPGANLTVEECEAGMTVIPVYKVKTSGKPLLLFVNR